MEIKQHSTGTLTAQITVNVTPDDYREQVDKQLKEYARKANLKGFRPGMVPVNVVRKMFGKGVLFDELNKILGDKLQEYIKENNIALVGEPMPATKDVDLDADSYQSYEFVYELGLAPDVNINYTLAGNAPLYRVDVDDEILDREVDDLRSRHGEMSNPEESQEGDILYGKITAGEWEKMVALNPTRIKSDSLKAEMGKTHKAGDTFSLTMADLFENDAATRRFWETNAQGEQVRSLSDEELEQVKAAQFSFELKKINRVAKLDVGPELYEKAFGEDHGITDEAEFRARVAKDMEGFFNREAIRYFRSQAIRALVEGSDLPLPDDFLKRWLIRTREKITDENIESIYPSFERSTRWRLLVEKMQAIDPTVLVNEEDIRERARQMVASQFASMVNPDETERLDQFAQYYLKDEKTVERLFDEVLEDRVFGHIGRNNPPAEQRISATAFMEVLKAENN